MFILLPLPLNMHRRHHHHVAHRPVVVVPRHHGSPMAGAMLTTVAVVGTAAVVGSAMSGRRNQQNTTASTQQCHAPQVIQHAAAPVPPPTGPVRIYLKGASGSYLTEDDKRASSLPTPHALSVWSEQHVGNGYYVLKSFSGRLLSVCEKGDVKLATVSTPVEQKCMFFREQVGEHCRYRSVHGFFFSMEAGRVFATQSPSHSSLFFLELAPAGPVSYTPPPPQNVTVARDPSTQYQAPAPHQPQYQPAQSLEYPGAIRSAPPQYAPSQYMPAEPATFTPQSLYSAPAQPTYQDASRSFEPLAPAPTQTLPSYMQGMNTTQAPASVPSYASYQPYP